MHSRQIKEKRLKIAWQRSLPCWIKWIVYHFQIFALCQKNECKQTKTKQHYFIFTMKSYGILMVSVLCFGSTAPELSPRCGLTAVKRGERAQFPPKLSLKHVKTSLKFSKHFAFKPKVKAVAEKLSFILRIWPGNLLMDILRDSQLVIFSHSTIFITFSYKSLAGFLFKLLRSSRQRKPEVALDFCVWPLWGLGHCLMFLWWLASHPGGSWTTLSRFMV